jgi:hypothetical protein
MLKALDELVESRIRDAQRRGEFAGLPGEGRPLPDEDLSGVPDDLRVAYRILKNAGCVPLEVDALRELDGLIAQARGEGSADAERGDESCGERTGRASAHAARRRRGERRMLALTAALEARGLGRSATALHAYRDRLVERLGR